MAVRRSEKTQTAQSSGVRATRCQDEEAVEAKPAVNPRKVKDTSGCRGGGELGRRWGGLGLGSGRWGLITFDLFC